MRQLILTDEENGFSDDYSGPNTAHLLDEMLLTYIAAQIPSTTRQNSRKPEDKSSGHASPDPINEAIKLGFLQLDNDIIQLALEAILGPTALNEALPDIEPANTGSCALVAIYDVVTQLLRVANVGDSRAVLGRRNAAGEWEAIPLSVDQTASDVNEAARIKAEHPNELNVVENGRVLGMAVSRAFGDIKCVIFGPLMKSEAFSADSEQGRYQNKFNKWPNRGFSGLRCCRTA